MGCPRMWSLVGLLADMKHIALHATTTIGHIFFSTRGLTWFDDPIPPMPRSGLDVARGRSWSVGRFYIDHVCQ